MRHCPQSLSLDSAGAVAAHELFNIGNAYAVEVTEDADELKRVAGFARQPVKAIEGETVVQEGLLGQNRLARAVIRR